MLPNVPGYEQLGILCPDCSVWHRPLFYVYTYVLSLSPQLFIAIVCALHEQCAPAAKQVKNCKNTNIFG